MKTFATKEKRSAPAVSKSHHYVHHPVGPMQQAQQIAKRKILRAEEVQAKSDLGEPEGKYEQEINQAVSEFPVQAISGIQPGSFSEAPSVQRSESEDPNEDPEEELQRQPEEEEEPIQAKLIQRQMADMRVIRPFRFGYVGLEVKAQQAETHRIIHSHGAQAKLTIGQPNDKYEQEADRVADQVMRMSDADVAQRRPENEEEEETVQTKPLADQITPSVQRQEEPADEKEDEEIQAKSKSGEISMDARHLESRINSLKGGGQPLDPATRAFFEPRFAHDFSPVRLHTGSHATDTAQALNAKAFTKGRNIVFGKGNYAPEATEGKRLLAHELTHVVQQKITNNKKESYAKGCVSPIVKSTVDSQIQRQPVLSKIDELDEMLGRFNVPEEELIALLGNLSADEKTTVLSGRYKNKIASALNIEEMVRAVNKLNPSLYIKLDWVEEAAFTTSSIDYSNIKSMITKASNPERDALKTTGWRDFFVDVCTNTTMVEALNDLKFDLETKLNWLNAEMTVTSWELDYATIKPWIIPPTSQAERDALKTTGWRDFFVDVCTNTTMVEALNDLKFDLETKLNWLNAEMTVTSWELDYATIKPWIIPPTSQAERDALKTTGWRDFFVDVCTNTTMIDAVKDLNFDPPTQFDWIRAEGGIELTLQMFATWSASDILGILSGLSSSDFDTVMSAMTQAQTQNLIGKIMPADTAAYGALIERIKTARLLVTAGKMVGELRWRGGSGPDTGAGYQVSETTAWGHQNDFAKWILGTGPEPTSTSTMNCWEGVLFMAYKAGIVTKVWLDSIHTAAASAGAAAGSAAAYYTVLENRLYSGPRHTFTYNSVTGVGSPHVPAGNIIFVNGIDHVMLSKGTQDPNGKHEVISLWVFPSPGLPSGGFTGSEVGVIQSTTIEEVLVTGGLTGASVEFANAPW